MRSADSPVVASVHLKSEHESLASTFTPVTNLRRSVRLRLRLGPITQRLPQGFRASRRSLPAQLASSKETWSVSL